MSFKSLSAERLSSWHLGLAWVVLLLVAFCSLERPAPLLLNLGAGDAPYARGFRSGWERDGLTGSGETQFRWTLDGARLEFPVTVLSGHLSARLRLARFVDTPVEMTLLAAKKEVDRFEQRPHGWLVRDVDLGELSGPLVLQFRSRTKDGDAMGVALDWAEVRGAGLVLPRAKLVPGLLAFFLGLPALLLVLSRSVRAGLVAGCAVSGVAAVALLLDRLGGLAALSAAGSPGLALLLLLAGIYWVLGRLFPPAPPWAVALPLAAALVGLVSLFHPFYYYPDVETHARFVGAIRADPALAWNPTAFQMREGTWTRQIAGQRVAFPYSPVFHLAALPLSFVFGETSAVKLVGIASFAGTLYLVFILSRLLGLGEWEGLFAQTIAALLPVGSSRLSLALYPGLLGEALELFLAAFLVSARSTASTLAVLFVSQLTYIGSLVNVSAVLSFFLALELLRGDRARALRLLILSVVAAVLVFALLDLRFVPTLFREVMPHLGESSSKTPQASLGLVEILRSRLGGFFDAVVPLLAIAGIKTLREARGTARHMGLALLLGGLTLLILRVLAPALFEDVKDVELLLPILSVLASGGLFCLSGKGRAGPFVRVLGLLLIAYFGLSASAKAYADRFFAIGR